MKSFRDAAIFYDLDSALLVQHAGVSWDVINALWEGKPVMRTDVGKVLLAMQRQGAADLTELRIPISEEAKSGK